MYLDFFGLDKEPFHITPDPDFLYLSPSHKEALATVMYGVQQQKGFIAVTGEVGTGKTTVLRAYMEEIEGKKLHPIYLFDPALSFEELLETMLHELGMEAEGRSTFACLQWLRYFLIEEYKKGYSVVLLVDEAQNMPVETMEKLRILSNLETTKDKLLQIVLIGQPELEEKLQLHALRQLNQRIAVRTVIKPLSKSESEAYLDYRLAQAGGTIECCFTRGALRRVIRYADGNPRLLNIASDNTLIAAYGAQKRPATGAVVEEVIADLKGKRSRPWVKRAAVAAAAVALLGVFALLRPGPLGARSITSGDREKEPVSVRQPAEPASEPETAAANEVREPPQAKTAPTESMVASLPPLVSAGPETGNVDESVSPTQAPPAPATAAKPEPAADKAKAPAEQSAAATPPERKPASQPETGAESPGKTDAEMKTEQEPAEPVRDAAEKRDLPETAAVPERATPPPETTKPDEATAVESKTAGASEPAQAPERPEPDQRQVLARAGQPSGNTPPNASAENAAKAESREPAEPPAESSLTDAIAEIPFSVMLPATEARPASEAQDTRPAPGPGTEGMRRRAVRRGDSLIELLRQEYGYYDQVLLRGILEYNPRIQEADVIYYGESLVFPPIDAVKRAGSRSGAAHGQGAQGQKGTES